MTYPTRQECDESFDDSFKHKPHGVMRGGKVYFPEFIPLTPKNVKSHISTLRKNDLAFLREMLKKEIIDITPHINKYPDDELLQRKIAEEISIYNRAINKVLSLLTECEEKLK